MKLHFWKLTLLTGVAAACLHGQFIDYRYIKNAPSEYFVHNYGAKCDGSTDDTTAIQAAITALGANRGTIVLPNGICVVTTLTITSSFQGIRGQSRDGSILKSNTNAAVISIAGSIDYYYLNFRDFTIEGDSASTSQFGISATTTGRFNLSTIRNMQFRGIRKGLYVSTGLNSDHISVVDNLFGSVFYGIERTGVAGGSGWIISQNQFYPQAGGTGFYYHGAGVGDIVVNNNHIEEGAIGIHLDCSGGCTYGERSVVNGNKIDGTTSYPILANNISSSTFLGNRVQGGGAAPVTFTGTSLSNIYDANENRGIILSGLGSNDNLSLNGIGSVGTIRIGTLDESVNNTDHGISIKDIAADVAIGIGQSQANSLGFLWDFNATPSLAAGVLYTFGNSNPIKYQASEHQFNNGNVAVNTNLLLNLTTPASSSATCTASTVKVDADYIYVCTATNTWKRAALTAF